MLRSRESLPCSTFFKADSEQADEWPQATQRPTGRVITGSNRSLSGPKFLTRYARRVSFLDSGTSAPQPIILVRLADHCFSVRRCWRTRSVEWQERQAES